MELDRSLDYLGPEMKQELDTDLSAWMRRVRLLRYFLSPRITLKSIEVHFMLDGKHELQVTDLFGK